MLFSVGASQVLKLPHNHLHDMPVFIVAEQLEQDAVIIVYIKQAINHLLFLFAAFQELFFHLLHRTLLLLQIDRLLLLVD